MALVKNKVSELTVQKTKVSGSDVIRASWRYPKSTTGDMKYFKQFTVTWKYSYGEKIGSEKIWYTNSTSISFHETDTTLNFVDFNIPSVDPTKVKYIYVYVKVKPECNQKDVTYIEVDDDGDEKEKTKKVDAWSAVETKSGTITFNTSSLIEVSDPPTPTVTVRNDKKLTFSITGYTTTASHAKSVKIQTMANNNTSSGRTYNLNIKNGSVSQISKNKMAAGNFYQVRARGYSEKGCDGEHSKWSNWSEPIYAEPKTPKGEFKIQVAKRANAQDMPNVVLYDESQRSAEYVDEYELQYTTVLKDYNWDRIDGSVGIQTVTFAKANTPTAGGTFEYDKDRHALHLRGYFSVPDDYLSKTVYFRIRSKKGDFYSGWSETISYAFGEAPAAPTVWSPKIVYVDSEELSIYYTHNTIDGSKMHYHQYELKFSNLSGLEKTFTSTATINPDAEKEGDEPTYREYWPTLKDLVNTVYNFNAPKDWESGQYSIAIKFRTAGNAVTENNTPKWSPWSNELKLTIWAQPTIELTGDETGSWLWDPFNFLYDSITTAFTGKIFSSPVTSYPMFIQVESGPEPQKALYYTFQIMSNANYEIMGFDGITKNVMKGEVIYSTTMQPSRRYTGEDTGNYGLLRIDAWDCTLKNNTSYTLRAVAVMNSGLTASLEYEFETEFKDYEFMPDAEIALDNSKYSVTITPNLDDTTEYEEGETPLTISDVVFHIWRRNYDDTMTNIATAITGDYLTGVIDPHPIQRGGLYRIVAMSKVTGEIVYADIPAPSFKEVGIIIQWDEEYQDYIRIEDDDYASDDRDTLMFGSGVNGSFLFLPYNIDTSSSYDLDTELVNYLGREHPVSYYGTQTGESLSLSTEIPKEGTEDIVLSMRRLSVYRGNCYIREPSGVGFWARIEISFNINHLSVTIPVSITATRVEGGV